MVLVNITTKLSLFFAFSKSAWAHLTSLVALAVSANILRSNSLSDLSLKNSINLLPVYLSLKEIRAHKALIITPFAY